jgi:hypothetical protein
VTGSDLLARLERLVAAGGGTGRIYVRSGGAYHRVDGWLLGADSVRLRTTPVLATEVDPAGLVDFDTLDS